MISGSTTLKKFTTIIIIHMCIYLHVYEGGQEQHHPQALLPVLCITFKPSTSKVEEEAGLMPRTHPQSRRGCGTLQNIFQVVLMQQSYDMHRNSIRREHLLHTSYYTRVSDNCMKCTWKPFPMQLIWTIRILVPTLNTSQKIVYVTSPCTCNNNTIT